MSYFIEVSNEAYLDAEYNVIATINGTSDASVASRPASSQASREPDLVQQELARPRVTVGG